jgi:hypothetical protein
VLSGSRSRCARPSPQRRLPGGSRSSAARWAPRLLSTAARRSTWLPSTSWASRAAPRWVGGCWGGYGWWVVVWGVCTVAVHCSSVSWGPVALLHVQGGSQDAARQFLRERRPSAAAPPAAPLAALACRCGRQPATPSTSMGWAPAGRAASTEPSTSTCSWRWVGRVSRVGGCWVGGWDCT